MKELTVSKKQLESEVKKLEKKESYNKKALEISKTVISNLGLELESYKLYSYDQILELLEEKMNIDMDYGLFLDVVEALEKDGLLSTNRALYFPE